MVFVEKGQKDELIGLVNRVMKKLSLELPKKHKSKIGIEKKKHHSNGKEESE